LRVLYGVNGEGLTAQGDELVSIPELLAEAR
jgi:hypothetical protein